MNKYAKKSYANHKENGLCVSCGKPTNRETVLCEECQGKSSERHRQDKIFCINLRICPDCRKHPVKGQEKKCPECRAKDAERAENKRSKNRDAYNAYMREYQKRRYTKMKASGVCVKCGIKLDDDKFSTCIKCQEKDHNRKREKFGYGIRQYNRKNRYKIGLCYFCDNPIKRGYKVCEEHYDKFSDNLKNNEKIIARREQKKNEENIIIQNRLAGGSHELIKTDNAKDKRT